MKSLAKLKYIKKYNKIEILQKNKCKYTKLCTKYLDRQI